MNIVDTISQLQAVPAPRQRRSFSRQFKAQVLAECAERGNSIAGVALRYGLNANLVHKWRRAAEQRKAHKLPAPAFVPLAPARSAVSLGSRQSAAIRIEIQRGDSALVVNWPLEGASECAAWLREWLR